MCPDAGTWTLGGSISSICRAPQIRKFFMYPVMFTHVTRLLRMCQGQKMADRTMPYLTRSWTPSA